MNLLAATISAVLTEEERIDCSEQKPSEIVDFLSSMTNTQMQKIGDFLENMPALKHDVEFHCTSCEHHNKLELKGLSDFF